MKSIRHYLLPLVALPLYLPLPCLAAETDLLQQQEGYKGQVIDAHVESIELFNADSDIKKITISVPFPADQINNVEVFSKDKQSIKQKKPYEIVKDYDEGRSGIVIYLGKQQKLPFRINFNEDLDKAMQDPTD